jgi:hypothetical protein
MRYFLTLILIGMVLAGCSSTPRADQQEGTSNSASGNPDIASIAPEGKFTEDVATNEADSSSPDIVMTVNSPAIQLTPIQGNTSTSSTPVPLSTENWQTHKIAALGIAVDYPTDWSIAEQSDGAIFTSPVNTTILLKQESTNQDSNEIRIGNTRCTSRMNSNNLTAEVCVDTASFTYTAKFTLPFADGSTRWLTLTTKTRTTGDVFEAMFNSVRLAE